MRSRIKTLGDRLAHRLLPLLLLGLIAAGLAHSAWITVRHVQGAKRTLTQVEGKDRAYWELLQGGTLTASVNGPAVLRVVTRTPYKSKFKGQELRLHWTLDGKAGGEIVQPVVRSRAARQRPPKDAPNFGDPAKWPRLSTSRAEEIRIPYGTHKVQVTLDQAPGETALLRLKLRSLHPLPKGSTVDLLPRSPGPSRMVAVKDKRIAYQVLRSGEELAVDVTGPTIVKVFSRLDWNETMNGLQKYQLKVFEDGALKNTWVLRGRHSSVSLYPEKNDSTPARAETIYIDVPAGPHQYRVKFQDSGREVNLRFIMPREALRNGGK